jgi:uncharacterized membrane protein
LKVRVPNVFLIIDLLVVLLIVSISLVPSSGARVVIGLPFLLLFPGFVLMAVLFPGKGEIDGLERLALSFGMSIPVVALIGLGLNYTTWGIRLTPVLYSVSAFILIMSAMAMYRRRRLNKKSELVIELNLKVPGWEGSKLNKTLSVVLLTSVLAAAGILIYAVAEPKVGEKFTEFYILGTNGKAQDYPTEFVMAGGGLARVGYGNSANETGVAFGRVTVGIENREQEPTGYTVRVKIDGEPVSVYSAGRMVTVLGPVDLAQGEKTEPEIGFAPQHAGDNQKVEFLLYKNDAPDPYLSLHLWINVTAQAP